MLRTTHRLMMVAMMLLVITAAQVHAEPEPEQQRVAPTYRVFGTREGLVGHMTASGHIIQPRDRFVALPSWRALYTNGQTNYVRITYKGRSVVVPVLDVGPWNTHDDYWSPNRENYRDLPVGVPMAQAAYFDGYNGGLDQFGRRVSVPSGIDIGDGTFWDDLGMHDNDWVEVTFLWLGADPGPGAAVTLPAPVSAAPVAEDDPVNDPVGNPASAAEAPPEATPISLDHPSVEQGAMAVDNNDSGYRPNQGTWQVAPCGLNGDHVWTHSTTNVATSGNRATWVAELPEAGVYELLAYIPRCGEEEVTRSASYTIHHDGGVTEVTIDQAAAVGTWTSLGTYVFGGRATPSVDLSDLAGDDQKVIRFDAMMWAPRTDDTPPRAQVTAITLEANGFRVEWEGSDDLSGVAAYDVQVRQEPNGTWRNWMRNTSDTSAWFGPHEGKTFSFRVRARDQAGNEQPWDEAPGMEASAAR